jgi:DNA replication initiation complex subunit (GINS family)
VYNELYEAWKRESDSKDLTLLPADFYARMAGYFKRVKGEKRMLEKRTAKTILLEKEMRNAERMLKELVLIRCRKITEAAVRRKELTAEAVTFEERALCPEVSLSVGRFMKLFENIRLGQVPKSDSEQKHAMKVLRFLGNVPSIIGIDMKTYGPFTAEVIASVPAENADILVKRKIAVEVCTE